MSDDLSREEAEEVDDLVMKIVDVMRDGAAECGNCYAYFVRPHPEQNEALALRPMRESQ